MTKFQDKEKEAFDALTGMLKHYCPEWDYMAIDETCPEMSGCLCYPIEQRNEALRRNGIETLGSAGPGDVHSSDGSEDDLG